MSKLYTIKEETLTDIADALRFKLGGSELTMTPNEMAQKIRERTGAYIIKTIRQLPDGTIFKVENSDMYNIDESVSQTVNSSSTYEENTYYLSYMEIAGGIKFYNTTVTDRPNNPGIYNIKCVYSLTPQEYEPAIHIIRSYPEIVDGVQKQAVILSWSNEPDSDYTVSKVQMEISTVGPTMENLKTSTSSLTTDSGCYTVHLKVNEGKEDRMVYLRGKMTLTNKNDSTDTKVIYSEVKGMSFNSMGDSI